MADPTKPFTPPYLPWRTFFNFLDRLADEGAPDRIDRSFLKSMDGQTQSYLMSALKAFGLMTEEGRVQEALGPLVRPETRQDAVRDLLQRFYPDAVALPKNATQAQLDEKFRGLGLGADAMRKAETFYLRAAGFAGIELSSNFKNPTAAPGEGGTRTTTRRAPRKRAQKAGGEENSLEPEKNFDTGKRSTDVGQMRREYFDLLRKKADEAEEIDAGLFDRIERLLGVMEGDAGGE